MVPDDNSPEPAQPPWRKYAPTALAAGVGAGVFVLLGQVYARAGGT